MIKNTPAQTRRIIVGDIHGALDAFTTVLRHAGLIDRSGTWKAVDTILIQTGDVIDRGPDSIGAVALLRTLQTQAVAHASRVVRCCGNHELMLLQDDHMYVNFRDPSGMATQFRCEVADGLLQAAYTDGVRLYTHAGARTVVYDRLVAEIREEHRSGRSQRVRLEAVADHINTVFRNAVAEQRCDRDEHCMFWVDAARGGDDEVGGIFWCDYANMVSSAGAWRVPQVFGHTPSGRSDLDHARGLTLINVDAGMCQVYGGHTVYLEITAEGETVQHSQRGTRWSSKVLRAVEVVQ
jgi:hypothetical protein